MTKSRGVLDNITFIGTRCTNARIVQWVEAWEHWICWARLGQPMRAELSAMIFSKSLRRKDVKGVRNPKTPEIISLQETAVSGNESEERTETDPLIGNVTPPASAFDTTNKDEGDCQKSQQSTINLVVSLVDLSNSNRTYPNCECRQSTPNEFQIYPYITPRSQSQSHNF